MKILNFVFFVLLSLGFVLSSCNSKKEDTTTQDTTVLPEGTAGDPNAAAVVPVGNQKHFICPNNCEGSGGDAQANCPVCGTAYVHNQAFHNQSPSAPGAQTQAIQIGDDGKATVVVDPSAQQQQPIQDTPANPAAKNAAGEWHFVCSKACGGGAGAQGTCPKCGSPLTHNQSFHQ
ncbi:MAG: hypothetical protein M3R25_11325 [Bacteroidota bacterium]|nr:hypothetical protein [Bacteroidota bacterium]